MAENESPASKRKRLRKVLVVEDEKHMAVAIEMLLRNRCSVKCVATGTEALEEVRGNAYDLALLDIMLPDISGIEVLRRIREISPDVDAIMVTAVRQVKDAVEAMKLGATDYIEKPFEKDHLLATIDRVFEGRKIRRELDNLRREVQHRYNIDNIVGRSASMNPVFNLINKMASSDSNVLITGESGTGKELVARAIHYNGLRKHEAFVAVNCACFPEGLLESELFGHEKGAFTGADRLHRGKFELADGGTLFLDEIGNMSLPVQAKLLRVIEEMRFLRLGGEKPIEVDVRLISATNADLLNLIKQGLFREDLYYRLKVVTISLPPLRERKGDIPLIIDHIIDKHYRKTGKKMTGVSDEALELLLAHRWKGNIRELENIMEMCMALEDGDVITTDYFPNEILDPDTATVPYGSRKREVPTLLDMMEEFQKQTVFETLEKCEHNKTRAAKILGIHRNTIEKKLRRWGMDRKQ